MEAKLLAELEKRGFLSRPGQPAAAKMQYSDLHELPYLAMVCKVPAWSLETELHATSLPRVLHRTWLSSQHLQALSSSCTESATGTALTALTSCRHTSSKPGLQEAMRVRPVASSGTTRRAARDLKLCGHLVPKGSLLVCPFDAAHRLPANFGPDADDFLPVRALLLPAVQARAA